MPYTTTTDERDLALALGIPLYGTDPQLLPLGTKTGCRQLFAEVGVAHPLGRENIRDLDGVVGVLAELRAAKPESGGSDREAQRGVSGRGNALVDLRGLPAPGSSG